MKKFAEICRRLSSAGGFLLGEKPEQPEELQVLAWELGRWLTSKRRQWMLIGEEYFAGRQDILREQRLVIGRGGQLEPALNLPNNRLVNNQYAKLVNQKTNYMLGQPISWEAECPEFADALSRVFDRPFMRLLKRLGKDCYNQGIAWLYPYIAADGRLAFARFAGSEILPFWADAEHNILTGALRLFGREVWRQGRLQTVWGVEVYDSQGVRRFGWEPGSGRLTAWLWDAPGERSANVEPGRRLPYLRHRTADGGWEEFNWQRAPLIPFKLNERELPLICRVKSLQDALNTMLSGFENVMQEDSRNTILVIKNYDGTDLAEFRHNLAAFGAVKVKTIDGAEGGIDSLAVEVDAGNYQAIIELLQRAIIENGLGFDSKLDRAYRAANELNIKSMYSDICLDANDLETEWQASFADLLWFVKRYLAMSGQGNFLDCGWRLIFNRDIMIDESEVIENCLKSRGLLSEKSVIAQHPWVNDVEGELRRLRAERVERAAVQNDEVL